MGRGADQFARDHGLETADPDYFFTQKRWKEYLLARQIEQSGQPSAGRKKPGTVGAVCLDRQGNLAAGSSTGGIAGKKYGRVGDSPIIGGGIYADNCSCAVSCSGDGEYFLRRAAAHRVASLAELAGMSLQAASGKVLEDIRALGGQGGMIAVDRAGNLAMPFSTPSMFRGVAREGLPPWTAIFDPAQNQDDG